jgi:5'-3' exonuclease
MFNIKITQEPIVFFDCSYYIFHRYFATKRWISFQKNAENINFLEAFERHFENDLNKLCKKFKTTRSNMYFCVDCYRNTIWRNEYLKTYKQHRVENPEFDRDIFDYFKTIIKDKFNLKLIHCDSLEADDIIAIIHKEITDKVNNIIIITNDSDYVQLKNDKTTIINMQLKDITLKHNLKNYTIYKALIGDKSDNIKRVGKITKATADKIIQKSTDEIYEWLKDNELLNEYNANIRLIDFNYIPKELINNLLSNIKMI